jgi:hypothetical protein
METWVIYLGVDMSEISIIWSTEDVLIMRPDLTEEQAEDILFTMEKHHDAGIGINWYVLENTAALLYPESEETDDE